MAGEWSDLPVVGGGVAVPDGETAVVRDSDAASVAAATSIALGEDSTLIFSNTTSTVFLNATLSNGSGAKVSYAGTKSVVITGDNSGFTGTARVEGSSTLIVSNRYGLGSSATPEVRVEATANLWFGGNGLTNDVPLRIIKGMASRRYQQNPAFGPFVQNGSFVDDYDARYGDTIINGAWSVNAASGTQRVDDGRHLYINGEWTYGGLFRIAGPGTIHINHQSKSSVSSLYYDTYGSTPVPTFVFGVENALKGASEWKLCTSPTLDLNGYNQSCNHLTSPSANRDRAALPLTVKSSSGPATLTITEASATEYSRPVRFEGPLSVTYSRTGKQIFTKWQSTATGALTVTAGTLEFAEGAGWAGNVVNVTGGTLLFSSPDPLSSSNATVTVNGGTLEVASGSTAAMRKLVCGAKTLKTSGTHAVADLVSDGFSGLSGSGSIYIADVMPIFSATLDPGGDVTVTDFDEGVVVDAGKVVIPDGQSLSLDWADSGMANTRYEFKADVESGSLKVYRGESLVSTISASGTYDITAAESVSLRFVADGEGVKVYGCSNKAKITVSATDSGLSVVGGVVGENIVPAGGSLTLTIVRTFDSTTLTTGITVNGVAYDFEDHPNGVSITLSDADRLSDLTVSAVYAAATTAYYVDPENGSDANRGYHSGCPMKSPQLALDTAASGDTVYLMPGVYSNGATRVEGEFTYSRLSVSNRVYIVGLGRKEDVIILGASAPPEAQVAKCKGCGEGAVRCVYMSSGATIRNLTLSGGRAYTDGYMSDATKYETGAGVHIAAGGGYIVDCIVTNCIANVYGGIRANGASVVNSRITHCESLWHSVALSCHFYGCVIDNISGAYLLHSSTPVRTIVNTTIGPGNSTTKIFEGNFAVYNSVIYGGINTDWLGCAFYRTYFASGYIPDTLPTTEGKLNDSCRENVETGVDEGADYSSLYPSGYEAWAQVDINGTPRILGGAIDVGGVEYDWRSNFAADVYRGFVCLEASPQVVERDGCVRLPDGASVTFGWKPNARVQPLVMSVRVSDGTLTLRRNGAVVATFTGNSDWSYGNADASDTLTFSYSGAGFAEILRARSANGLQIIFR